MAKITVFTRMLRTIGFGWRRAGDASVLQWLFPATWLKVMSALLGVFGFIVAALDHAPAYLWIPLGLICTALGLIVAHLLLMIRRKPHPVVEQRKDSDHDKAAPILPTDNLRTTHLHWLGLSEAIDAFCDPEIVERKNKYAKSTHDAYMRGHEIEDEMRAIRDAVPGGGWAGRDDALKEYNELRERMERHSQVGQFAQTGLADTWGVLREEICNKLISGELIAQGFAEPYHGGAGEAQIKASEWRILTVNPNNSTAVRRDDHAKVVYSGVQIANDESPSIAPPQAAPAPKAEPPTMLDLFKADFPGPGKIFEETNIQFGEGGPKNKFYTNLYQDFSAGSKFLAFYVPRSPMAHETYVALASQSVPIMQRMESGIQVSGRMLGEGVMTASADLAFTGFIYLYCDDGPGIHELSELTNLYEQNGLKLRVRASDYHSMRMMSWHHAQPK
jgi:hypothetical protein